MLAYSDSDVARFWNKVFKTENCWLWQGPFMRSGYGNFSIKYAKCGAHRFSYLLAFGELPEDMYVCHRCDNPACVRPDHLFVGSQADNLHDAALKGRTALGEKNGHAKLTAAGVVALRERYASGGITQAELAKEYGIHRVHVYRLLKGRRWPHVAD